MGAHDGTTDGASGGDATVGKTANSAHHSQSRPAPPPTVLAPTINRGQIMETLKQLGELKSSGVLTAEEFAAKRKELLDKL